MICCYCQDEFAEGDHVMQTAQFSWRPYEGAPPDAEGPFVHHYWAHVGCWRLHMRQQEEEAQRRLTAKRARFAA